MSSAPEVGCLEHERQDGVGLLPQWGQQKIGVTLRNNFSVVFTNFEFVKPVPVIGGKNLHGKVDITSGKNLNHNPAAFFCVFDH